MLKSRVEKLRESFSRMYSNVVTAQLNWAKNKELFENVASAPYINDGKTLVELYSQYLLEMLVHIDLVEQKGYDMKATREHSKTYPSINAIMTTCEFFSLDDLTAKAWLLHFQDLCYIFETFEKEVFSWIEATKRGRA